jgi:phosphatidate cytidylyltransferase
MTAVLTVVGSLAWQWLAVLGGSPVVVPLLVAAVMLAWAVVGGREMRGDAVRASWVALGVAYVGGLLTCGGFLRELPHGRAFVAFVAFVTWASDIGAYYVGSRWGRRPLAPRISPKKSVEGLLGGIAGALIVAGAGCVWIWPMLSFGAAFWLAAALALIGVLGDLAESVLKRAAGVKDSGSTIPGHGGVLDRLDSLIFAAPALYALVRLGWV